MGESEKKKLLSRFSVEDAILNYWKVDKVTGFTVEENVVIGKAFSSNDSYADIMAELKLSDFSDFIIGSVLGARVMSEVRTEVEKEFSERGEMGNGR